MIGAVVADATAAPIRSGSIDLIVTSPPYFNLRNYSDHPLEIGREESADAFIEALVTSLREMVRVLKPTGSIFVNLSDRYGDGRIGPVGNLMLLPHRFAIAASGIEGLICRGDVVWHKPNGIPENQSNRVRRNHEYWFHFTRGNSYYCDANAIRSNGPSGSMSLPSSVQTVIPEPYPELDGIEHPATFPVAWPRLFILGWSPPGWCITCGEPRRTEAEKHVGKEQGRARRRMPGYRDPAGVGHRDVTYTLLGEGCACSELGPSVPAVVLDPFGGSGTTAQVAGALGRHGVSLDISKDFSALATNERLRDARQRSALGMKPSQHQAEGQSALF